VVLALDEVQAEHGVGSRGFGVDGCGVGLSDGGTKVERVDQVVKAIDVDLVQTGQNDAAFWIFADSDRSALLERDRFGD
jgi:hypothetical protein